MPGALRAIHAASGGRDELGIALVERCLFEQQQDVVFYPVVQVSHGKQNAFGFSCRPTPILAEAVGEGLLLLCWLQLRQQQSVSDADLLGIERLYRLRHKLREPDARGDIGRVLADLRRDLLNAVLRLLQLKQGIEPLRLFQRVNVPALKIFD